MKLNYPWLWMIAVFMVCAYLSTHVPVEQHLSERACMSLSMIFIFGFGTIASLGAPALRNQGSVLPARHARVFSVLNFVCLFVIFGTAGWLVGGLVAFSQTNFIAFSVLLYFLGIRLGTYLQFHV